VETAASQASQGKLNQVNIHEPTLKQRFEIATFRFFSFENESFRFCLA
jgi:hypothetical protein